MPDTMTLRRILLILLLVAAFALPVAAQTASGGYDFFRTDPKGTTVSFTGAFALPAGFFGEGSGTFKGRVNLKGVPLGTFRDRKTGSTDTVMHRRTSPPKAEKFPGESRTEIELVALSLMSTQPIKVSAGGKSELWDVKVGLSSKRPSTGTMTLTQRSAKGGVARSEFAVYPVFTFTRRGDKTERTLDVGGSDTARDAKQLTMTAENIQWTNTGRVGTLTDGVRIGVVGSVIRHRGPNESHFVTIPPNLPGPGPL
jgi:hypothetical protein